jgi:ankyrin repeat protein
MTRGVLSIKNMNYTGIKLVLLALFVMCICSCASSVKEPSTKAATIEVKILSESVDKGDITKIEKAIQAGADVNVRYKYGFTPLLIASRNGHTEVVKLLLTAKADVNAAHKTQGITSLLIASQKGHTGIVKLLLTAGADVNTMIKVNGIDYTPLSIAKEMSHTRIVKLLEEYGAKD